MTTHRGLPVSNLTEFVGRDADLGELRTLVTTRRLVTITGEAGVGKSRTAVRLAEILRRSFGGSTARIEPGISTEAQLAETIATTLGATGTAISEIAKSLGDRPFLLILDNVDNARAAAPVVEELLEHTTETRVLVTSRERTGILGETPYVLTPLELPSAHALLGPPETALGSATDALLIQRILDIDPSFHTSVATMEDLFAVCRASDGLPRFIEAAARAVCVLGLRECALAVGEDPTVLDSFLPRGTGDHASAAILDASIARLSPDAVALMRRLSLLESGCDLRFAAELFAGGSLSAIAAPIAELVDRSLVRSETAGGERRLRVPLHYRTRLLSSWAGDDRADDERRVRDALLARLRHCAVVWFSDEQLPAIQFLNRHAADITPLLGAMAADPADAREALEIISSLRYYWQLHPVDPWPRARDWLGKALSLDGVRDLVTLRAMQTDAYIAYHEGDLDGARMQLEAIDKNLEPGLAGFAEELFSVFVVGLVEVAEGHVEAAEPKFAAVLRSSLEAGDRDHIGEGYWHLAACQIAAGNEDAALGTVTDGLAYCDQVGDVWGRGYLWCLLAVIEDRRGNGADAITHIRAAVEVMSTFGDRIGLTLTLQLMASVSAHVGDVDAVAELVALVPRETQVRPPVPLPELRGAGLQLPPSPLPDSQQLGDVLSRLVDGRDAPRPARSERADVSNALSVRENEIAMLIGEGLGNPAIAARLVLSRRTVEGHVQRILAKLGFRSRSQIAVWAAQQAGAVAATR